MKTTGTMRGMGFTANGIGWMCDPTDSFPDIDTRLMSNLLGMIPSFFHDEMEDVISEAVNAYGYCSVENDMKGGTVDKDGRYSYPGDPVLAPVAVASLPKQGYNVYVYNYGMITFYNLETDEYKTYRFD